MTDTTTRDAWDAPAWALVHAASPGTDQLVAALCATRASCDAAITIAPRVDGFDPANGWHTADGLLALLELTHDFPTADDLRLGSPPSLAAAALAIDEHLHTAADATLTATEALRGHGATDQLRAMATVMSQLAAGYQRTFGRPW